MENGILQLFDQNIRITEDLESLDKNKFLQEEEQTKPQRSNPFSNLEQALNTIFPDNQEETKIIKAKRILGEVAKDYSDERLGNLVTDFEYLVDTWLDVFEKQIFGGKTLRELTNT